MYFFVYFRNGDTTKWIYLQQTLDVELGKLESMKKYSEKVDILWVRGYKPNLESFNFIDKKKVVFAFFPFYESSPTIPQSALKYLKNFQNFMFKCAVDDAELFMKIESKRSKSQYLYDKTNSRKDFSRKDFHQLFGSLVSQKPLNLTELENSVSLFQLNWSYWTNSTPLEKALKNASPIEDIKKILSETKNVNEQIRFDFRFNRNLKKDAKEIVELLLSHGFKPSYWCYIYAILDQYPDDVVELFIEHGALSNYDFR